MAGNTKLMGFGAGSKIRLDRWGGSVMVEVSPESVEALERACAEGLPSRPLPHQIGRFELSVKYDDRFGQAVVNMSADVLEKFIGFLRHSPEKEAEFIEHHYEDLIEDLERVMKEHRDYTNTDEPGL